MRFTIAILATLSVLASNPATAKTNAEVQLEVENYIDSKVLPLCFAQFDSGDHRIYYLAKLLKKEEDVRITAAICHAYDRGWDAHFQHSRDPDYDLGWGPTHAAKKEKEQNREYMTEEGAKIIEDFKEKRGY